MVSYFKFTRVSSCIRNVFSWFWQRPATSAHKQLIVRDTRIHVKIFEFHLFISSLSEFFFSLFNLFRSDIRSLFEPRLTTTPLMRQLYFEQKLSQSFSYFNIPFNTATPLIDPDFSGPLVTGLSGFHCTC